jgi:hypothetical protein
MLVTVAIRDVSAQHKAEAKLGQTVARTREAIDR